MDIVTLFPHTPALIGMVHLKSLPGSPRWGGSMEGVIEAAVEDARRLEEGGAAGLIIENFYDAPFTSGRVEAHTVSALTLCVHEIRKAVAIPVGVNVLRNDGLTALSIAAVTGARFIRVNVLTHAMVTDQGIIEGCAYELSRLRRSLGAEVTIFADVMVKHAYPLGSMDLATAAKDIAYRGGADVLIVSGPGTGEEMNAEELEVVRRAVPGFPIASGSGISAKNLSRFRENLDIVIAGTALKKDGLVENPVDPERVGELASLLKLKER
jgi:hypothetical protein